MTWELMETVPKDGTRIDVQTDSGYIIYDLFYGYSLVGHDIVLRGSQNSLSNHVKPVSWRPTVFTEGKTEYEKAAIRMDQT